MCLFFYIVYATIIKKKQDRNKFLIYKGVHLIWLKREELVRNSWKY